MITDKMRNLIDTLNYYRDQYYNHNNSVISDEQYDNMFDELKKLEEDNNIYYPDSPTQSVGYEVKSNLAKITHNHPMLSLDKTKSIEEIHSFLNNNNSVVMAKMDGLTCSIKYENGKLVSAETRGNGSVGEDVTHNIRCVKNVPQMIPVKETVVVDGEIIITEDDFEAVNNRCNNIYANPRNLAAGSIRLLDSKESSSRPLKFILWKVIDGTTETSFTKRLLIAETWGFTIVPNYIIYSKTTTSELEFYVNKIKETCNEKRYPIDGCVFGYDNIDYADSLGMTSHHVRSQMAFKFYDEKYKTTLRYVDWTMGKTGSLTPTAVFDTVEIDGTAVSRASMHNLTIMKKLNPTIGCTCDVFKANMIIPQIDNCYDDGDEKIMIPKVCPICGEKTEVRKDNESEVLYCVNPECKGKLLGRLCTFVSKQGMNIEGLSEGRLQQLMDWNAVTKFSDIYELENDADALAEEDGWGEKLVKKIITSIHCSQENTTLDHYLTALSIEGVGATTAKAIADYYHGSINDLLNDWEEGADFSKIPGQGPALNKAMHTFIKYHDFEELNYINILVLPETTTPTKTTKITGKTFCITGTFSVPRSELQKQLENCGGTFTSGVSKKTDVLFVGSSAGSKLDKASKLGIQIVTENELEDWIK